MTDIVGKVIFESKLEQAFNRVVELEQENLLRQHLIFKIISL